MGFSRVGCLLKDHKGALICQTWFLNTAHNISHIDGAVRYCSLFHGKFKSDKTQRVIYTIVFHASNCKMTCHTQLKKKLMFFKKLCEVRGLKTQEEQFHAKNTKEEMASMFMARIQNHQKKSGIFHL